MFEKIVLRRSVDGPPITIGEIAEALIFYQKIHLILDYPSLFGIIEKIGMPNLLKLLSLPEVTTTYIEELPAVHTQKSIYGNEYDIGAMIVAGHEDVGVFQSRSKRLAFRLERHGYKKEEAKKYTERFRRCVTYKKLGDDFYVKGGIFNEARADLFNKEYVTEASKIIVQNMLGNVKLPEEFSFNIRKTENTFSISTNLDFKNLLSDRFTPAHIASELYNATIGLIFAGHYGGDFYTSDTESKIIQLRQRYLLRRFQIDQAELGKFNQLVLADAPSIAETLNQEHRSFEEFLELLSSAKRFKKWLKGKSPDESIISNYIEDITAGNWSSSISGKLLRYVCGSAVGLFADPATGIAVSAGDSFLLDKYLSGWKPNQFIKDSVKPFVDKEKDY
ncbi:MAG: hypothetical protein K2W88_04860 [Pararheinheimera sp.]|nr:hypothetical protein [Rheinheimera sp.]